jgi:hypothetical protein
MLSVPALRAEVILENRMLPPFVGSAFVSELWIGPPRTNQRALESSLTAPLQGEAVKARSHGIRWGGADMRSSVCLRFIRRPESDSQSASTRAHPEQSQTSQPDVCATQRVRIPVAQTPSLGPAVLEWSLAPLQAISTNWRKAADLKARSALPLRGLRGQRCYSTRKFTLLVNFRAASPP